MINFAIDSRRSTPNRSRRFPVNQPNVKKPLSQLAEFGQIDKTYNATSCMQFGMSSTDSHQVSALSSPYENCSSVNGSELSLYNFN